MSPRLPLAMILMLAACGAQDADYPKLLPMDQILAEPIPAADPAAIQAELGGDAAALRARAARLRGPVIDTATRARMQAMRNRHR